MEVKAIEEDRFIVGTTDGVWTMSLAIAGLRTTTTRSEPQPLEIIGPIEPPRPKRKLDDLTQPRESVADVLMQAVVGRHIGEGRAPRSNRRVVRAGSSRGDPDPEPEPPLVRTLRKVAA